MSWFIALYNIYTFYKCSEKRGLALQSPLTNAVFLLSELRGNVKCILQK